MTTYEKVYTSETEYHIRYNFGNGKSKVINKLQDLYTVWCQSNTPDVINYVPPTPKPLEQLRLQVIGRVQQNRQAALGAGMLFEGMAIHTATDSREWLLGGSRKAKRNPAFIARVILADGSLADLTNKQLKDLEDALDDFGDPIWEQAVSDHETALTATREQLQHYLENGEFE